jgi:hypothetical protein
MLIRWNNYFCQLLNVQGWGFRQTEIQTAEPFLPESSASEFEAAIRKLKSISHQVLIRFQQK